MAENWNSRPPDIGGEVTETSGGSSNSRHRNNGRNSKKDRKNLPNNNPNNSFKGPLTGYETYVYDVNKNSGSDEFNTTTVKLSEYISRTVQDAGEFMNAMNPNDLGFEAIPQPNDPPDGATAVEYKKWKTRYKNWDTKTNKR